jgi:galactose mutarotase-like enzyme
MSAEKVGIKAAARASYDTEVAGWPALVLENELLKVTVLPGYGGWILSAIYKPRQAEMLWQSARGVIPKEQPPIVSDPLFQYRDRSPGGWPEIFPHGSAPVQLDGVTMPFHGEAVNRVWDCEILQACGPEVVARMTLKCHLMPLRLERILKLRAGSAALILEETATNYSDLEVDFMWGHHPIFGRPLMSGSSRVICPAGVSLDDEDFKTGPWPQRDGRDWASCPAPGADSGEMFYLHQLEAGWAAVVNPEEDLGIGLSWDLEVFPYVWIWRQSGGSKGYPYFGQAYCVAIEPFSSLPGARQRGERLLKLPGGASLEAGVTLSVFEGLDEVSSVDRDGTVL